MNARVQLKLPHWKPWQWALLGVGVIAAAAAVFAVLYVTGAWAWLRQLPVREWLNRLAALGPGPFLLAFALLPAVGAPVSVFYVMAGAVFASHGGLPMALAGCFAAITVNIALTYALGRWLMHPVIERLVRRFGWTVPKARYEDRFAITLLVRVTPGPPFFVQSYLLALGQVPFGAYLLVSVLVSWASGAGVIVFGDGLASGSGGKLLLALSFIIAVVVIVRLVRGRMRQRALETSAAAGAGGQPSQSPARTNEGRAS